MTEVKSERTNNTRRQKTPAVSQSATVRCCILLLDADHPHSHEDDKRRDDNFFYQMRTNQIMKTTNGVSSPQQA